MRRSAGIALAVVVLAGCGGSGLEGTLKWKAPPSVSAHAANGSIQNTTSHSVALDAGSMRLLDDRGKKVAGKIRVPSGSLPAGQSARLSATWKSGKPVRIDYGEGTLALGSD
jgi:hypothetical protein